MPTGLRPVSTRRALSSRALAVAFPLVALASLAPARAAIGPDVTVFAFTDFGAYGSSGGFVGYSIGTRSCNRGDTPLNWCDQGSGCAAGVTSKEHPVIAQNLYRLKNHRFEQVGMSWLKHGFLSTNSTTAGCTGSAGQSCQGPPAGQNQLGVGCTDPYNASLNGSRPLGRRSEVDATTGVFPFPYSGGGSTAAVHDQRLKVAIVDVEAASNPGATFYAEGHYIASDDHASGNSHNNASYRRVTIGASPNYALSGTGTHFERQPAIFAWPANDNGVALVPVDILTGHIYERFWVGRRVTDLGGGVWHYEYAVHNLNSNRSARAFSVDFRAAANFTNVGFKDIDHHSNEPYATTDWAPVATANSITWSTDDFATNANANALRWSTLFNFWFDADQPPSDDMAESLELFKPGSPTTVAIPNLNRVFSDDFETESTSRWDN